jgi:uncharacterized protein YbaA (DUF1428 family)
MSYVDGFLVPVPKRKLAAYRRMAAKGFSQSCHHHEG